MPVHHERDTTPQRRREGTTDVVRSQSIQRTKQRELSVERRPIISQDKPRTTRSDPKQKTSTTRKSVPKREETGSTAAVSTRNRTILQKEVKVRSIPSKPAGKKEEKPSSQNKKTAPKDAAQKVEPRRKPSSLVSKEKAKKVEERGETSHVRSRTRTLSPSEVRILKRPTKTQADIDKAKLSQLSRQAPTGPISKEDIKDESGTLEAEDSTEEREEEYEDDFEDYESDFEEESEAEENAEAIHNIDNEPHAEAAEEQNAEDGEEQLGGGARRRILVASADERERERERKLDSGSYHIAAAPHRREIEEIKTAMQNENRLRRKQSLPAKEADEGYLEGEKEKNFVLDFTEASQRSILTESHAHLKKRGELLSQMISLDAVNLSIMEIPAVPYEVFMSTFGKSNTSQVLCQTNEDDCEEEIQTDHVDTETRWTQMPATYQKSAISTKEERLGVGRQRGEDEPLEEVTTIFTVNVSKLNKFFESASEKILTCLEARKKASGENVLRSDLACCDGMITMPASAGSVPVSCIAVSDNLILTVKKISRWNTIIEIWSLTGETVVHTLTCRNQVTTSCFGQRGSLVFAGANDGSINVWDLRESVSKQPTSIEGAAFRSPTYSTAQIFKNLGHNAPVVNLVVLDKDHDYISQQMDQFTPLQVCSLSEMGEVIIWSVVQMQHSAAIVENTDLGLAHWGTVRLVNSSSFYLSNLMSRDDNTKIKSGQFRAMACRDQTNELLIADDSGRILYCSTDGTLLKHKFFLPRKSARPAVVSAIAIYPYDTRYFLAGCTDGTIRLHSVEQENPLICLHWNLKDASCNQRVESLFWLPNKPCMFLVLDANSRVHVWNLAESDIYPQFSLPKVALAYTCAAFVQFRHSVNNGSIILGRGNGDVEIHNIHVDKDKIKEIWKKETKMFQKYVKIL